MHRYDPTTDSRPPNHTANGRILGLFLVPGGRPSWRSRARGGRRRVSEEIRTLIRQIASENLDWGAPKIHGELLKLGFEVSERAVARYLRRLRPRRSDPAQRWLAFLANHREAI